MVRKSMQRFTLLDGMIFVGVTSLGREGLLPLRARVSVPPSRPGFRHPNSCRVR